MSSCISLLSGKGGSGKTTLGLGIAKMLSSCGISVLFVDCDLSTHGATYFFEHLLVKTAPSISFYEIASGSFDTYGLTKWDFISIADNFFFVPSIASLPLKKDIIRDDDRQYITKAIQGFCMNFSVVICDCQAGYTSVLDDLLPQMDLNLLVMEPDAISSASIRVLYSQISSLVNEKKTFQVFNKITKEECEVYDKVTFGTLFTNLPPILFNWEVRKAFALSQVPELKTTNSDFGNGIYVLCQAILPKFQNELDTYMVDILEYKRKELKDQLQQSRKSTNGSFLESLVSIIIPLATFFIGTLPVLIFLLEGKLSLTSNYNYILTIMIPMLTAIMISTFPSIIQQMRSNPRRNEYMKIQDELDNITTKIHEIRNYY